MGTGWTRRVRRPRVHRTRMIIVIHCEVRGRLPFRECSVNMTTRIVTCSGGEVVPLLPERAATRDSSYPGPLPSTPLACAVLCLETMVVMVRPTPFPAPPQDSRRDGRARLTSSPRLTAGNPTPCGGRIPASRERVPEVPPEDRGRSLLLGGCAALRAAEGSTPGCSQRPRRPRGPLRGVPMPPCRTEALRADAGGSYVSCRRAGTGRAPLRAFPVRGPCATRAADTRPLEGEEGERLAVPHRAHEPAPVRSRPMFGGAAKPHTTRRPSTRRPGGRNRRFSRAVRFRCGPPCPAPLCGRSVFLPRAAAQGLQRKETR